MNVKPINNVDNICRTHDIDFQNIADMGLDNDEEMKLRRQADEKMLESLEALPEQVKKDESVYYKAAKAGINSKINIEKIPFLARLLLPENVIGKSQSGNGLFSSIGSFFKRTAKKAGKLASKGFKEAKKGIEKGVEAVKKSGVLEDIKEGVEEGVSQIKKDPIGLLKKGAEAGFEAGKDIVKETIKDVKSAAKLGAKGLKNFIENPQKFSEDAVEITGDLAKEAKEDPGKFAIKYKLASRGLSLIGTASGNPILKKTATIVGLVGGQTGGAGAYGALRFNQRNVGSPFMIMKGGSIQDNMMRHRKFRRNRFDR